jgi:AcrR family transcriptional regulator
MGSIMPEDTKERVLAAAGPIFAEKGYQAATVREICTAAGTNQAAINYHFRDKASLYLEVVQLAQRIRLQQVPPAEWPEGTAPAEKLRLFIHATLTRMLDTRQVPWPTGIMLREMLHPTDACQPLVEQFIRPQFEQLLAILRDLVSAETPSYRLHQLAFSIIGQCVQYRVAGEFVALLISEEERSSHYQTGQLAAQITQFSLAALTELSRQQISNELPRSDASCPVDSLIEVNRA